MCATGAECDQNTAAVINTLYSASFLGTVTLVTIHSTFYISCVLCPVSQSNLNLDQNESRPKTPFKASIFCRGRKKVFTDVVKMTWQNWSELDHVSMVVLWKYSGRFKNMLEPRSSALTILKYLYLIKLFSQQDLRPAMRSTCNHCNQSQCMQTKLHIYDFRNLHSDWWLESKTSVLTTASPHHHPCPDHH